MYLPMQEPKNLLLLFFTKVREREREERKSNMGYPKLNELYKK